MLVYSAGSCQVEVNAQKAVGSLPKRAGCHRPRSIRSGNSVGCDDEADEAVQYNAEPLLIERQRQILTSHSSGGHLGDLVQRGWLLSITIDLEEGRARMCDWKKRGCIGMRAARVRGCVVVIMATLLCLYGSSARCRKLIPLVRIGGGSIV